MAKGTAGEGNDLVVQEHCIDLPGESVQCWIGGGTDKLKVILRKHRDVIFDINLGNHKTYTLETTESDYYNARDKKLIYAARNGKVEFKDGERLHVWVSRGFRGALVLKCGDQVITEVKPNDLDATRYSQDPKEKPAPIIFALSNPSRPATQQKTTTPSQQGPDAPSQPSLHVHEVSEKNAPPSVLQFLQNGAESLNLDKDDIITRNWIIAQFVGAETYLADNRRWMKEIMECEFKLQRVVHKSGPKTYMIFSGNNKLREYISASRYGLSNAKIITITGGAGGTKQAWDTAKGAALDSLKMIAKDEGKTVVKAAGIMVVFTIAVGVAEWYKDFSEIGPDGKPKKNFYDLAARVGIDLVKAGLVAAVTSAAVAGVLSAIALAATFSAGVVAVVVGTIIVACVVGFFIDKADKALGRALGTTDTATWLAEKFRETASYLSDVSKDVRYQRYALAPILPIGR